MARDDSLHRCLWSVCAPIGKAFHWKRNASSLLLKSRHARQADAHVVASSEISRVFRSYITLNGRLLVQFHKVSRVLIWIIGFTLVIFPEAANGAGPLGSALVGLTKGKVLGGKFSSGWLSFAYIILND